MSNVAIYEAANRRIPNLKSVRFASLYKKFISWGYVHSIELYEGQKSTVTELVVRLLETPFQSGLSRLR
jgi:hypothetical protein